MAEEKRQFPTEIINLPSKGALYSKESTLSTMHSIKYCWPIEYELKKSTDIKTKNNFIKTF